MTNGRISLTGDGFFFVRGVSYPCPHCGEELESKLKESGKSVSCCCCGKTLVIPGRTEVEAWKKNERERKRVEKQKEEVRRAKECERRRIERQNKEARSTKLRERKRIEDQNEEARGAKERERNLIEKQNEERRRAEERKAYMAELVLCPYCRGEVRRDAQKCRHCSEWVSGSGHSDMLAFILGLLLGPVGLWYKGRFAEGFAWLAASTFYGWQVSLRPELWIGIPGFWIGMAIHAAMAKGKR